MSSTTIPQPNGIPTSLTASYSSSGFAPASPNTRSLPFGPKPALLVIDVCDAYLTPGSPLYGVLLKLRHAKKPNFGVDLLIQSAAP